MGMGYGANYNDVIEDNDLNNITKGAVNELIDLLEKGESSMEELAMTIYYDDDRIENEELFLKAETLYEKLKQTFFEKTGLNVELSFHDSDDGGSRYDEVNGYFWAVYGMYQLSPEGKKIGDIVKRKLYVTFG